MQYTLRWHRLQPQPQPSPQSPLNLKPQRQHSRHSPLLPPPTTWRPQLTHQPWMWRQPSGERDNNVVEVHTDHKLEDSPGAEANINNSGSLDQPNIETNFNKHTNRLAEINNINSPISHKRPTPAPDTRTTHHLMPAQFIGNTAGQPHHAVHHLPAHGNML